MKCGKTPLAYNFVTDRLEPILSIYASAQSVPNAVIMSDETAAHFYAWLDHMVPRREQFDVEQDILALLRDHPDLIETHSWPEMERMARR